MGLPDFLVVGAMKAGTTTLIRCLADHHEIFIAPRELHFFSDDRNYNKGIEWYSRQFMDASNEIAIGEKTPTYSYFPNVPERIHKDLPRVKLIWIFREPVARAYSNYWHYVINGLERLDFESAIYREEERLMAEKVNVNRFYDTPYWWYLKGYRRRSIYIEQVSRYMEFFPKDQMLFICFEQFMRDPHSTLKRILEFLEVSTEVPLKIWRCGATRLPRSRRLAWISKKLFRDTFLFQLAQKFNRKSSEGYPPMEEDTRHYLKEYFKEYNRQLAEVIEQDLSIWDDL